MRVLYTENKNFGQVIVLYIELILDQSMSKCHSCSYQMALSMCNTPKTPPKMSSDLNVYLQARPGLSANSEL